MSINERLVNHEEIHLTTDFLDKIGGAFTGDSFIGIVIESNVGGACGGWT